MMFLMMLSASIAVLTACSSEDPFESNYNNFNQGGNNMGGDMNGNGSSTAGSGELLSFSVDLDRATTEPTSTVTAYYPDAEDNISQQTFATQVTIDMSNPVAKTENGVEITVSEGHVTANHGSTEGICYVVTGTTANGSLTIDGKTNFELNLNGVDITNPTSTAIDIESKKAAFIVLTGTNKLTDGTAEDHKSALYGKGKLLFSGTGALDVYGTYNNGIHTKSYVVIDKGVNLYVNTTINHGIKASDAVVINGGVINIETSGTGAKGINCDNNIYINGGRFDGSLGSTTQGIATTSGSVTANATVTVSDGSSTLASFTIPPYSYNSGTILVSAPDMKSGSSYTLNLGSSSVSVTASNTISNSGMGGGQPGGQPGGRW